MGILGFTCGSNGLGVGDIAGYSSAASSTMVIGHALGKLTQLLKTSNEDNTIKKSFCIGHSLGAHVCGFAGKTTQLDGILGLDPAGPIFHDNMEDARLSKGDAKFVQALHIDAGELGIDVPIADQDVYVNTGKNQPLCQGLVLESVCSHTSFTLNFLPKIWGQADERDGCFARTKCSSETQAMVNHFCF